MFILAGICSIVMAALNNILSFDMDFVLQILICASVVTGGEYLVGITLNADHSIWDYRGLWGTFSNGQLNVVFILAWVGLSAFGIILFDYIEWRWLHTQPKAYYRFRFISNKKFEFY